MYQQQVVAFLSWHMAAIQMAEDDFLGLGDELKQAGDKIIGDMIRSCPGMSVCWDTMEWSYPQRDRVDEFVKQVGSGRPAFGEALV